MKILLVCVCVRTCLCVRARVCLHTRMHTNTYLFISFWVKEELFLYFCCFSYPDRWVFSGLSSFTSNLSTQRTETPRNKRVKPFHSFLWHTDFNIKLVIWKLPDCVLVWAEYLKTVLQQSLLNTWNALNFSHKATPNYIYVKRPLSPWLTINIITIWYGLRQLPICHISSGMV